MEGDELSGNGSRAGCAGAYEVRGMYGVGRRQLWVFHWIFLEYRFFPFFFFFLSGWATNTLFCPCPFTQSLVQGGRVCAIRSQQSMYGN